VTENNDGSSNGRAYGVQSTVRAFGLLETMADHDGPIGLSQLATESELPLATTHRLVRTLVGLGYVRQETTRQYALGPRLMRLGESSSPMLALWARPHLSMLVDEIGESANLAMLDGDQIVCVAQAQSHHAMRVFTETGKRVLPHCTAIGKVLLAGMPSAEVLDLLGRTGMPAQTPNTITDPDVFAKELARAADLGYAVEEGEQEIGVCCVSVAVPDTTTRLAISVSGPAARMTEGRVERAVSLLHLAAKRLSMEVR
jgi:IclR family acetate operon transcriptional repressor